MTAKPGGCVNFEEIIVVVISPDWFKLLIASEYKMRAFGIARRCAIIWLE